MQGNTCQRKRLCEDVSAVNKISRGECGYLKYIQVYLGKIKLCILIYIHNEQELIDNSEILSISGRTKTIIIIDQISDADEC